MSARLVNVMKKWWMIALVFALALSLTSCAKKRETQSTQGFTQCDSSLNQSVQSLGQIDVYTRKIVGQQNRYELIVVPIQLAQPGDVVDIHVVNKASFQFLPMIQGTSLDNNQPLVAGTLTQADIDNFDVVTITYYQPGLDFLSILRGTNPQKANVCTLPYPGDNLTN
jgi:hypothetical protein